MKMKKLCFWIPVHIGDIYISSFFIKHICSQNPDIEFLYYTINGDIFFTDIPNLKFIETINDPNYVNREYTSDFVNGSSPETNCDSKWLSFLLQNIGDRKHIASININNVEYVFVNTWCACMGHDDFNFESASTSWSKSFKLLNDNYDYSFKFNFDNVLSIINDNSIPRPLLRENVTEFFNKTGSTYKKTIFCYNYIPRSLPLNSEKLQSYLQFISNKTDTLLILATHNDNLCSKPNVISCDVTLHIEKQMSCENLLHTWNVAARCDEIIILPTGSSWLFYHNISDLKNKKMYLFGNKECTQKLNKNIDIITNDPEIGRIKSI